MTDEQIEDLKREVYATLIQNINSVESMRDCVDNTIDYLKDRLLADGCVGVPREPTGEILKLLGGNIQIGMNPPIDTPMSINEYRDIIKIMEAAQKRGLND